MATKPLYAIPVGELRNKTAEEQADIILAAIASVVESLVSERSDGKRKSEGQIQHDKKLAASVMEIFWNRPGEPISKGLIKFERRVYFKSLERPHMTLYKAITQFVLERCDLASGTCHNVNDCRGVAPRPVPVRAVCISNRISTNK